MPLLRSLSLASTVSAVLLSTAAFAHDEHCHLKVKTSVIDDLSLKTKKECVAKGGEWRDHHLHCHVDADGGVADEPTAKNEKACAAKGGRWSDHGHELY